MSEAEVIAALLEEAEAARQDATALERRVGQLQDKADRARQFGRWFEWLAKAVEWKDPGVWLVALEMVRLLKAERAESPVGCRERAVSRREAG